ncbi:MAG: acyltransferase [Bacteroidaceae bacterium]|nr:acyltransferase [Bacteroidaceae bacterium]
MSQNTYLESKPHYEILDGLRGVAAFIVVCFHLFESYGGRANTIGHGYLAVDFFFALSGFVIGYAYDDRWNKMTTWGFFKRRLVRLHPMVILAATLAMLFYYFTDGVPAFHIVRETAPWVLFGVFLWQCLMIPLPQAWDIRGYAEVSSLGGTFWTLHYEYFANFIYALFVRRFNKIGLWIFVAICAVFSFCLANQIDILGLWGHRWARYSMNSGFSLTVSEVSVALTRLMYPFFAGLLVSRMGWLIKVKGGFWWCSLLVAILLIMPPVGVNDAHFDFETRSMVIGANDSMWMNGIYESFVILLMFPLIVSMGAGSKVVGKKSSAICKFLGELSYPLYLTHFSLVYIQQSWVATHQDSTFAQHAFVFVAVLVLSILQAYACLKLYDLPIREWLKEKWLKK